jgi:O-antigen ligase
MSALCSIAAAIALVWGLIFVLRGSLIGWCLAYLVTVVCFGYDFAHFTVGPVPLTIDRIVLLLVIVTYAVQRRLGRTNPKPITRIDLVLAAFLGLLVLSVSWGDRSAGSEKSDLVMRLVGGYLIPGVVYWIARQAQATRRDISAVYAVLVGLGVYLAVTGVLEMTGQWWGVFPRYIADPKLGLHFGRARGPMLHAVSYGLFLAVCLLAAWLWQWRFGRVGRLLLVALVPLMLPGIYFSYTRSVWMGMALGLFLVLAVTLHGAWRKLALSAMISAGVLLAATRMESLVRFDRELSAKYTGKSVELRGHLAYVSWKMFLDRPLLGVGFDRFPTAKLPYLSDRSTELNLEAARRYVHHNTFLSLLTETGLVGLGLFLALLGGWGWKACRLARDVRAPNWARATGALALGALGVYVCQALFHELSYLSMDNTLLFLLAGVAVSLQQPSRPTASDDQQGPAEKQPKGLEHPESPTLTVAQAG